MTPRKLSPAQVAAILKLARSGSPLRAMAAQFDVSHETIRTTLHAAGLVAGARTSKWEETT